DLQPAEHPAAVLIVEVIPETSPLLLQPDSPLPSLSRVGVGAPVVGGIGEGVKEDDFFGFSLWYRPDEQTPFDRGMNPAAPPPVQNEVAPPAERQDRRDGRTDGVPPANDAGREEQADDTAGREAC